MVYSSLELMVDFGGIVPVTFPPEGEDRYLPPKLGRYYPLKKSGSVSIHASAWIEVLDPDNIRVVELALIGPGGIYIPTHDVKSAIVDLLFRKVEHLL